jgi:hypothetical protein
MACPYYSIVKCKALSANGTVGLITADSVNAVMGILHSYREKNVNIVLVPIFQEGGHHHQAKLRMCLPSR